MGRIPLFLAVALLLLHCGRPVASGDGHDGHEEEASPPLTAYSSEYELFAESDPLIVGRECSLLAHFTHLSTFKPLLSGRVALSLAVAGQEVRAESVRPERPGIYRFTFTPRTAGTGRLTIAISAAAADKIVLDGLAVHKTEAAARLHRPAAPESTLAVAFSKEMSWKVDFATAMPQVGVCGDVIKTVAQVQSAPGDEAIVAAKASGVVRFGGEAALEGKALAAGQRIFSISGGGLADNNPAVRFVEAQNNYQRARADYERARELAKERIVAEKERLRALNEYENARAVYENLDRHFSAAGQVVTSPFAGFVKQVFVQNGQYVNTGQPVVTVSQNRTLLLRADVRQALAAVLAAVVSATVRTPHDNRTYTLEQLRGRILSVGKSVNPDNYLIPVSVQVDNIGGLLPGGLVELFLKTAPRAAALSIPTQALLEEQGSTFVFVQIHPERFEKREVRIGASDGLCTEVLGGITAAERVVSRGAIWVKLAQAAGTLDAHSGHVH